MARTPITAVQIPDFVTGGYDLTNSADFATLVPGADNGVEFTQEDRIQILLKNPTAGAAVYTFEIATPSSYARTGATVTDPTRSVAAGVTEVHVADAALANAGKFYIDCDVAAQVLVLKVA